MKWRAQPYNPMKGQDWMWWHLFNPDGSLHDNYMSLWAALQAVKEAHK